MRGCSRGSELSANVGRRQSASRVRTFSPYPEPAAHRPVPDLADVEFSCQLPPPEVLQVRDVLALRVIAVSLRCRGDVDRLAARGPAQAAKANSELCW